MRSLTLFFLLSVIPFSQRAMAAILTVYNLNNTAIADYANIYEAYNNAADGDTILLYPSDLSYEANLVVTKRLFLIGGGYSSTCYYGAVHMRGSSVLHMDNSIFISEGQITIYAEGGSASGKNNLMFGAFRGAVDFHHSIQTNPWNYDGKLDTTTISKNNQIIPDISVVYTDFAANIFTLKPGSPAFGNAEDSSNISIYDGASPFVDGGFPKLPLITHLDVPLTGSQTEGINVSIKVKSQN